VKKPRSGIKDDVLLIRLISSFRLIARILEMIPGRRKADERLTAEEIKLGIILYRCS
jgi:hypothetical protein